MRRSFVIWRGLLKAPAGFLKDLNVNYISVKTIMEAICDL